MKLIGRRLPLFALLAATVVSSPRAQAVPLPSPEIVVLSNRADLISGGDALVEVKWPARSKISHARVMVGDVDVTSAFTWRADGRYIGLVTGLQNGPSVLTAHVPGAKAQIVITNHPITGPVVSGPHIEPYECRLAQNGFDPALYPALDADCSVATMVKYYYRGSSCQAPATACFKPLTDPTAPRPADLLYTKTNTGVTVPYIVRLEAGTINRGVYRLAMLDNPGVTPFPGPGWNGKLVMQFG